MFITHPSLPASAEKFPGSKSPGTNVTIDSPVLAASVPPQICRSSCNTLMSCDWIPPSDTDTFINLTGMPIMVLRVAMVPRNTRLYNGVKKNNYYYMAKTAERVNN